jgi:hypothetical protein
LEDRNGDLLGATILLSPEEVNQLQQGKAITIEPK